MHKAGEILSYCKPCAATTRKEKQGPETHWYRIYGLTPEEARLMKERQGNRCAICREDPKPVKGKYKWAVDHDHQTGKVRGLLCRHCNTMLGFARDNPLILESAIRYLEKS